MNKQRPQSSRDRLPPRLAQFPFITTETAVIPPKSALCQPVPTSSAWLYLIILARRTWRDLEQIHPHDVVAPMPITIASAAAAGAPPSVAKSLEPPGSRRRVRQRAEASICSGTRMVPSSAPSPLQPPTTINAVSHRAKLTAHRATLTTPSVAVSILTL